MIGKTLFHYKVFEKIRQGGMEEVYRAEDTSLKREVAIKVFPKFRNGILSITLILFLTAVGLAQGDDHGDNCGTTTSVSVNSTRSGSIETGGDSDYFRIEVPSSGTLTVYTTGFTDTVGDLYLGCTFRANASNDDGVLFSDFFNFRIIKLVSFGTYYIAVRHFSNIETGSYTLNVEFTADLGGDDHGNDCSSATSASVNSTPSGRIGTVGDSDYFQVQVPSSGTLTVYTTGRLDTFGELRNSACSIIASGDELGTRNFKIIRSVSSGTYYVAVQHSNGFGTGNYTLGVEFTSGSGGDDHGNDCSSATSLSVNSKSRGSIETGGDSDYFQVQVPSSGTLTVFTTGSTDTFGEVRNSACSIIYNNDDADFFRDDFFNFRINRLVSPGTHYIAVRHSSDFETGSYKLNVVFNKSFGGDDHGNDCASATSVSVNSTSSGRIGTDGDSDYFQVQVPSSGTLTVYTTGSTDTVGELRNSACSIIASNDNRGSFNFRISRSVSSGAYYVTVRNFSKFGTGSYTLNVELTSGSGGDEDGTEKWAFPTGGRVSSSPAIGPDGTVYASSGGSHYAINPDGTQRWAFQPGGAVQSSPAIGADGTVYAGSGGSLYAIHPDGTQKWVFQTTGVFVTSSPAIGEDGTLYVGSSLNLLAINPDGTQKWVVPTGFGNVISSPAIGADGTIYVGSGGSLYAINPDGTQKWVFQTTGFLVRSSPAIGADGTIYVGSESLYAINLDGTQKWVAPTGGGVSSSPAIGTDGTLYVGSVDHSLYAINPDGTQKWVFPTTGFSVTSSPAIGADGTLYVGSGLNLYAINPDGTQKWVFPVENLVSSSPAIGADGTIYVGSDDDNLYAINESSGGLSFDAPWPMFHRDLQHTGRVSSSSGGDDHGNDCSSATSVSVNSTRNGSIATEGDSDYFQIQVPSSGTLTVYTTGSTDTFGELRNSACSVIASNNDSDSPNFRISRSVISGTYYFAVRHFSSLGTGNYILNVEFGDEDETQMQQGTVLIASFMNGDSDAFNSRVYLFNPSLSAGEVTVRVFTLPPSGGLAQELTSTPFSLGTLEARSALNVKLAEDILTPLGITLPYMVNEGDLTLEFTIQAQNVRGSAQVFSSSLAFGTYPLQEIPSTSSGSPTVLVANFMNGNDAAFNSRVYLFNPSSSAGNITVRVFTLPLAGGTAQELPGSPLNLGTLEAKSALNVKLAQDVLTPLGITAPYITDGGNLTLEFTIQAADVRGAAQVFSSSFAFGVYPLQGIPSTSSGSPTVLVANFMNGNNGVLNSRVYLWNPSQSAGNLAVRVFTLPLGSGLAQELTTVPLNLGILEAKSARNIKLVEDILTPLGITTPYITDGGNLTLEFTIQAADARGAAQVFSSIFAFGTNPLQEIPSTSSGSPTVLVANFMNGNNDALNSRVYLWNPSASPGNVAVRVFTLPLSGGLAQELTATPLDLGILGAKSARNIKLVEDILTPLGITMPYITDGGNLTLEFTIEAADVRGAAQVFSSSFAFGTYPMQEIPATSGGEQECADISGDWLGHESSTLTCIIDGETISDPFDGEGVITITQQGCGFNYKVPGTNLLRNGVLDGNTISITGTIVVQSFPGFEVVSDTFSAQGSLQGNTITLQGQGVAEFSSSVGSFTCTVSSEAVFERN